MFQVTNLLTYASWSVTSRDELLSELEHANAKRQPLDPKDTLELIHTDENGEVLEKTVIDLPLTRTIDEVLENFGFGSSKSGKGGFLSRFLPFFPKGKATPPAEEIAPKPYELPLKEEQEAQTITPEVASDDVLNQLIKDTQRADEDSVAPQEAVTSASEVEQSPDDIEPVEETSNQVQLSEPHQEPSGGKVANATSPPKQEEVEYVPTSPETVPDVKAEEKLPQAPLAHKRDVESFTTYDLQQEFAGRIDREVAVIDDRIQELTAQIKQLEAQKTGHLQLLETINTYKLT
ncbi:hypothetical protein [Streptococcus sp. S784/96/1]|uniref:hypothetical protein n=1 Tax=Streptococcus sp. S784/96/1 TaxID=2653499 RepID=UPI001386B1C6|nr:hypothetical protein [Streptococcus sp. S784/96/1]